MGSPLPQPVAEALLRRAIAVSAEARAGGDHPFGALLAASDGTVLLEAGNRVETEHGVTAHAETRLVRLAWAALPAPALREAVLVTSCEPCAMCSGAIVWAGIRSVVYGLAERSLAGMTGADPANPTMSLPCRTVFAAAQHVVAVEGPLLEAEAAVPHEGFWRP